MSSTARTRRSTAAAAAAAVVVAGLGAALPTSAAAASSDDTASTTTTSTTTTSSTTTSSTTTSTTAAADLTAGLVAYYPLDETTGTTAHDASGHSKDGTVTGAATWNAGDGFTFSGGASSAGNAITLPNNLVAGKDDVTVDLDVKVDASLAGNWFLFNLGNAATFPNGTGYLFVTGKDSSSRYRGTFATAGYATEVGAARPGGLATAAWKHVSLVVDGGTTAAPGSVSLYQDGVLVAQRRNVTTSPASITASTLNVIGRSAYAGDNSFKGTIKDFRVYDRTLSGAEVATLAGVAPTDQEAADATAAALTVPSADDVRGNVTLPTTGSWGTTVGWTSSDPSVVATDGRVTRPAHGEAAKTVTLTADVAAGDATAQKTLTLTVQPLPQQEDKDAYLFAYFEGESTDAGESIYFGASKGNDALHWDDLNGGSPLFTSTLGTKGLRDPFIIRSADGDKFYLLATDLKVYPTGSFAAPQQTGSTYLEVWESDDLVHWSAQRHVKVSSDFAGNTWAPEAYYDEDLGSYVVYWASNIYDTTDTTGRTYTSTYNRMMYATTRDFVTFSEPKPWIDVKRGTGLGMIDATVIKDGDEYYRFVKDEQYMIPREEKSTDLLATVSGSLPTTTSTPGWQLVTEKVGQGLANQWGGTFSAGEGPTVFKANPGDVNTNGQDTWYLFMDQPSYHGGKGYVPFATTDLDAGTFTSMATQSDLPTSPRHGTVLPLTQAEYERVLTAYQPDLLVESVAPVSVTTREGEAPVLPSKVSVTYHDGTKKDVAVTWPTVDPAQYAQPGTFEVRTDVAAGSDVQAVATVTVTDAVDPVATITTTPGQPASGWFTTAPVTVTATGTDDHAVASVRVSVDGGAWTSTDGASASTPVLADGRHVVQAQAVDASGNTSAVVSQAMLVDTAAPVSKGTVDAAARSVTVAAADEWSGVARVEYRVGTTGSWSAYSAPVQVGAAATTVQYRAVDVAGNVEAANAAVVPASGVVLKGTSTAAVVSSSSTTYGKSVKVTVKVAGTGGTPSGTVRVTDGKTLVGSATLSGGKATVTVSSSLAVGSHSLAVTYSGDKAFGSSSDTVKVKVTKTSSKTSVSVSPKAPTHTQKATVTAKVTTVKPSGTVTVTVTHTVSGKTKTVVSQKVALTSKGTASLRLPQLAKGTYTVKVAYAGSSTATGSSATTTLRITK
ncbi:Ig-like domain repeat protein [Luteimicrobium subarcticum]|uniref:Ig-like domain-containing protein n=1 Tax=Luteimicrobium subarcticum TaxID=620910 RepID=A0A2M8WVV0_9MICO|nr:Ig-like domain repeat protein [Luteimicrobium subarcticum]PJI95036.1 Ig-like domain-containing protein [Luteimicrobium subarcticum]